MLIPSLEYINRLADAVENIVSCRDLCGDEKAALHAWEKENGQLSHSERVIIRENVEKVWRASQIAAGVKPLSEIERAKAYRDLT